MTAAPIICFGQQPCGAFPRRYLVAKIRTAKRLQMELGGEIVFFYHDSDHDPRETRIAMRHRKTDAIFHLNFIFANQTVRLFSPLYLKRIEADWHAKAAQQIREYADPKWVEVFKEVVPTNAADFCLEMYRRMGLLDGIRVARSSDPVFRNTACDIGDFFVDVPYEGEIVRARFVNGALKLHKGGDAYIDLPPATWTKAQISPTRDSRLRWMQSVLHCTHYIAGGSEQKYLKREEAPEITYVNRDPIDRFDEAYTELPS